MRAGFAGTALTVCLVLPASARAQESARPDGTSPRLTTPPPSADVPPEDTFKLDDYCERVREAGKSTAAVLLGPRVAAQAIKFPRGGDILLGQTNAPETQFRGWLQYSLTDAYHGTLSLQLGDADCRRQRLAQPLEDAIRLATDQGRRQALARQLRFLQENERTVVALERDAEARRQAETSTLGELLEIHTLAAAFRTQESEIEDALARLDAIGLPDPTGPLSPQAEQYERASMEVERLGSRIRQVAPWGLSLTGGLAANTTATVDWFGTLEVSYNLGGLVQAGAESRFLAARERELGSAHYELAHAARAVDEALARSVAWLREQIAAVEAGAGELRTAASVLEASDAPGRLHSLSVVTLRLVAVDAQLVYLRALAERRRPWETPR
jgi:hypothetical protein